MANNLNHENNIMKIYNVASVENGYNYYFNKILNLVANMFVWDGLPESLPQREIEYNLILKGYCVPVMHQGQLVTTNLNLYGYDKYYNPDRYTGSQPILGTMEGDIEAIIYDNSLQYQYLGIKADSGMATFIGRYARLLADIDSTIDIYMINKRNTDYPVASDSKTINSIKRFFKLREKGYTGIITDDSVLETFKSINNTNSDTEKLNDLLLAKKTIMSDMLTELGIKTRSTKRAQMQIEEVDADEQLLLINQSDRLESRILGCEAMNKVFGLNATVRLNEKYDRTNFMEKGVEEDGSL